MNTQVRKNTQINKETRGKVRFLYRGLQMNIGGMTALENHDLGASRAVTNAGKDHQWV